MQGNLKKAKREKKEDTTDRLKIITRRGKCLKPSFTNIVKAINNGISILTVDGQNFGAR